ncbi:MAG: hypothetical protein AB1446_07290 [Bacillota bacterium]
MADLVQVGGLGEEGPEEAARRLGQPPALVNSFRELWGEVRQDARPPERVKREGLWVLPAPPGGGPRQAFRQLLLERHRYTPAAADQLAYPCFRPRIILCSARLEPENSSISHAASNRPAISSFS